jgi:hypothetical protein
VLRRAGKPVSKHPSGQKIGDYASRRRKKMRLLSANGPVPKDLHDGEGDPRCDWDVVGTAVEVEKFLMIKLIYAV